MYPNIMQLPLPIIERILNLAICDNSSLVMRYQRNDSALIPTNMQQNVRFGYVCRSFWIAFKRNSLIKRILYLANSTIISFMLEYDRESSNWHLDINCEGHLSVSETARDLCTILTLPRHSYFDHIHIHLACSPTSNAKMNEFALLLESLSTDIQVYCKSITIHPWCAPQEEVVEMLLRRIQMGIRAVSKLGNVLLLPLICSVCHEIDYAAGLLNPETRCSLCGVSIFIPGHCMKCSHIGAICACIHINIELLQCDSILCVDCASSVSFCPCCQLYFGESCPLHFSRVETQFIHPLLLELD
jgi:hypothetical protein